MATTGPQYYRYELDDHGGVNYFRGNTPITNTEYAKATGKDTSSIELRAAEEFNWNNYGQVSQNDVTSPIQPRNLFEIPQANTTGSGSDTTKAAPVPGEADYVPQIVRIGGQTFDVNDPAQREAFFTAKAALVDQEYNKGLSDLEYYLRDTTADAADTYGSNVGTINRNLEDVGRARTTYSRDYDKSVNDFGEGWRGGNAGRINYFASLSPSAYQSGMGSSAKYAEDKYIEGLADMSTQKAEAMSDYDSQEYDMRQSLTDMETDYNKYLEGLKRYDTDTRSSLSTNRQNDATSLADTLSSYDVSQRIDPYRYNLKSYTTPTNTVSDLSAYTPYTSFNSVATSPKATNYFKPKAIGQTVADGDLSGYLGRNVLSKAQEDQLRKSLTKGY